MSKEYWKARAMDVGFIALIAIVVIAAFMVMFSNKAQAQDCHIMDADSNLIPPPPGYTCIFIPEDVNPSLLKEVRYGRAWTYQSWQDELNKPEPPGCDETVEDCSDETDSDYCLDCPEEDNSDDVLTLGGFGGS